MKREVLQNSRKQGEVVIPAKAGIQVYQRILDSGFRRNEGVSDSCKNLKKKLFGAERAEIALWSGGSACLLHRVKLFKRCNALAF